MRKNLYIFKDERANYKNGLHYMNAYEKYCFHVLPVSKGDMHRVPYIVVDYRRNGGILGPLRILCGGNKQQ